MAFNLPTEEEAQAILADQRGIIMHEFLEDQARLFDNEGDGIVAVHTPGPFQRAVAGGDVELVRDMLAAGEDPNRLDETGECAINLAMAMIPFKRGPEDADTVRDVFACIELCLDAGALPDGPPDSRKRKTPLGSAVQQGRPEFVRLLLSAGADPNVPADANGDTILHHATRISTTPRYYTTLPGYLLHHATEPQGTKLSDCYWRPAPITRPRATHPSMILLLGLWSATGITACGPYSSEPGLRFRTPGRECRITMRSEGTSLWRSATSICARSRRPAASRPTRRRTARDSWQLSRRSLRTSFRRSSFRSSSTSRFM